MRNKRIQVEMQPIEPNGFFVTVDRFDISVQRQLNDTKRAGWKPAVPGKVA